MLNTTTNIILFLLIQLTDIAISLSVLCPYTKYIPKKSS